MRPIAVLAQVAAEAMLTGRDELPRVEYLELLDHLSGLLAELYVALLDLDELAGAA